MMQHDKPFLTMINHYTSNHSLFLTGRICEADGNKAAGRADALIKTTGNKVGKLVADRNRGSCCFFSSIQANQAYLGVGVEAPVSM